MNELDFCTAPIFMDHKVHVLDSCYTQGIRKAMIVLVWFDLLEFILKDRGRELKAARLIFCHPHIFRVIRATLFVARWGIEPLIINLKGERFNH